MSEEIPTEYQEILHHLHSDVFFERLKDHLDPDGRSDLNEADASDLLDLARRLIGDDVSPTVDGDVIQKLLEYGEFRDSLVKATGKFAHHSSKELDTDA